MMGAISSRSSLSRRGFNLPGPAALPGLRFINSLSSPFFKCLSLASLTSCPIVSPERCQKADHPLFSNPALAFWPGVKETGVPLGGG